MEQKTRGGKRAGAGAPKLAASDLKKRRTVYMTDETWRRLDFMYADGSSRSDCLAALVDAAWRAREASNQS
jgi:hypothetical protein